MKKTPFLLCCLSACFLSCSQDKSANNLPDRVLCLKYKKSNDTLYIGSGFLLLKDSNYYIVTAAHNIKNSIFESINAYFKFDSLERTIPIIRLSDDSISSIRISNYYDLAIIKLNVPQEGRRILNKIIFPFSQISIDSNIFKKGLNVIGYGYYDFSQTSLMDVSPVEKVDSTTIESNITEIIRADTNQVSKFLVLKDTANKGMSGGPIFIANDKGVIDNNSKIIGIFHGYFFDKQKWYTYVTPLTELDSLINSFYDKK